MCWFVSKKKYNAMVAERDNYERIASETIQLNGRVIDSNARILEEMKGIQELNHRLQQRNEELLAYAEELEKQRDMLCEQVEAFEEGMYITREAE